MQAVVNRPDKASAMVDYLQETIHAGRLKPGERISSFTESQGTVWHFFGNGQAWYRLFMPQRFIGIESRFRHFCGKVFQGKKHRFC